MELKFLREFQNCLHIQPCVDFTIEGDFLYIALQPYVGTLQEYKDGCEELDIMTISNHLAVGVKYLFDNDIVHGKITIENIVYQNQKDYLIFAISGLENACSAKDNSTLKFNDLKSLGEVLEDLWTSEKISDSLTGIKNLKKGDPYLTLLKFPRFFSRNFSNQASVYGKCPRCGQHKENQNIRGESCESK